MTADSIQLLWKIKDGLIAEDVVDVIDDSPELNGRLMLKGKVYDGLSQIASEFVDSVQSKIKDLATLAEFTIQIDADNSEAHLMRDMLKNPTDQFWYQIGLSTTEPGKGVIATLYNFSYPDIFSRNKFETESKKAFLIENFTIDRETLEFHGESFFSIHELVGWCRNSRSEDLYYSFLTNQAIEQQDDLQSKPAEEWDGDWYLGKAKASDDGRQGSRPGDRPVRGSHRGGFIGKRDREGWQREGDDNRGNRDSNFGEKRGFNRNRPDEIPSSSSGAGWGTALSNKHDSDQNTSWGKPKNGRSPSPEVIENSGFTSSWGNQPAKTIVEEIGWGASKTSKIDEQVEQGWGKTNQANAQINGKSKDLNSDQEREFDFKKVSGWGKSTIVAETSEVEGWNKSLDVTSTGKIL